MGGILFLSRDTVGIVNTERERERKRERERERNKREREREREKIKYSGKGENGLVFMKKCFNYWIEMRNEREREREREREIFISRTHIKGNLIP